MFADLYRVSTAACCTDRKHGQVMVVHNEWSWKVETGPRYTWLGKGGVLKAGSAAIVGQARAGRSQ